MSSTAFARAACRFVATSDDEQMDMSNLDDNAVEVLMAMASQTESRGIRSERTSAGVKEAISADINTIKRIRPITGTQPGLGTPAV